MTAPSGWGVQVRVATRAGVRWRPIAWRFGKDAPTWEFPSFTDARRTCVEWARRGEAARVTYDGEPSGVVEATRATSGPLFERGGAS